MTKDLLITTALNCIENARDLFDDAELLFINKRYSRAYTLYHLSSEEIGKYFLILEFLIRNDYSESVVKKFSADFRDHPKKINYSSRINNLVSFLNRDLKSEKLSPFKLNKEEIKELNKFKNLSLYCHIEEDKSILPKDIIDYDLCCLIKFKTQEKLVSFEEIAQVLLIDINRLIKLNNL